MRLEAAVLILKEPREEPLIPLDLDDDELYIESSTASRARSHIYSAFAATRITHKEAQAADPRLLFSMAEEVSQRSRSDRGCVHGVSNTSRA